MWIAESIAKLKGQRSQATAPVALVPTLGALHPGHLSLIEIAKRHAETVIVSIFVNPTQFDSNEDLERYPRPIALDLQLCRQMGVSGVFQPTVEEMYPLRLPACHLDVPALGAELEGAIRPGHFAGVCRVVAKLLNLVNPHVACFGQKDFQQLRIIQALVADLNMPVGIIECPTLRDADGLALSSRNQRLTPEQRRHALGLIKALNEAKRMITKADESDPAVIEHAMRQVMTAHHVAIDYATVRHPLTLAKLAHIDPVLTGGVVALVAGTVGTVHLIDNMLLPEREKPEDAMLP
jgi:pantoate--beta-alanine ligase